MQLLLLLQGYLGHGTSDLTCHKGLAAAWTLVVEQNTVGGMHAVRLAVVDDDPVGVEFGSG